MERNNPIVGGKPQPPKQEHTFSREEGEAKATSIYSARTRIWSCKTYEDLRAAIVELGIDVDDDYLEIQPGDSEFLVNKAKKKLYQLVIAQEMGEGSISPDVETHKEKLNRFAGKIRNFFQENGSNSTLLALGSYGRGKINSQFSDIDFLMVVPPDPKEADIFKRFSEIGLFCSPELGPISNIETMIDQGHGLARLYGFTDEGIEIEFHVIAESDAKQMHRLHPGSIERVQPVAEKNELRPTVKGLRDYFPKPGDKVDNYRVMRNADGEIEDVMTGFFTGSMMDALPIYDNPEKGEDDFTSKELIENLYYALVKAYLYHNNGYEKENGKVVGINPRVATLENFFSINYVSSFADIAPNRVREFNRLFKNALAQIQTNIVERSRRQVERQKATAAEYIEREVTITEGKLEELRENGVRIMAADYDGTIFSSKLGASISESRDMVSELLHDVEKGGVVPAIITARHATLFNGQYDSLQQSGIEGPLYIATANGRGLARYENGSLERIYMHSLSSVDIDNIIRAYTDLNIDLPDSVDAHRQNSLKQDWSGVIPDHLVDRARSEKGVWIEEPKISLIFPRDWSPSQLLQVVSRLQKELGDRYQVDWGGKPVVDVSLAFPHDVDGKVYALERIAHDIASRTGEDPSTLVRKHTGTFGDTPLGNDSGLLSMPFGFTNDTSYKKGNIEKGPYVLHGEESGPERVHKAMRSLLEQQG